ncbi:multiple epidermal growth factor-like domains protein 11 [Ruditapes philippinarum]|uniref:multiple epidermal growth factor-like domains protein 11 n=1 Tax=Ruditapes philippinarum TaxID=129788 RepID=UPI00295A6568|nr:multiple epidermal growth factor-like domains protein 11 [Ruditapes philippinarum]
MMDCSSRDVTGLDLFANGTNNRILGNFTSANASDVIVTLPQGLHSRYITLRRPSPHNVNEWYLIVCEVEIYTRYCKLGTYGNLCEQQCGHCRQGPCKIDSGHCPNGECMAGWTGLDCKKECDLGHYGLNCSSVCSSHCFNDVTQCNKTTGNCMQGCEAGYMGHNCSMECTAGTFGRNCSRTCTNNCLQGFDQCSKISGECQRGCVSGFKGLNCSTPCETGRFGVNCSSYCSIHCFKGIEHCSKSSGICKEGCEAGYTGNNCSTVCPDGQYGRNCNGTCSDHCKGACNKLTGHCTDGCNPGFTGLKCFLECPHGTFGVDCSGKCHCYGETDCHRTDGNCSTGCAFGWSGSNCSNDLNLIERIREKVSTSQSSIFYPYSNPQDFDSSKAIDGVQNYATDTCKCCSVTNGQSPSWWQIDLGQKYLLGGLQIFGRESSNHHQLEYATVYAGNYSTIVNPSVNMTNVYVVPNMTNKQHFTKELEEPLIAKFVSVELTQRMMTLCELKLYEKECEIGNFGTGCTHKCHCKNKRACNQVTGKCQTPGCLAGWQGEACEKDCDVHKFGEACTNTCNCKDGTLCDNTNGTCFIGQCDPGWLLPTCSEDINILRRLDVQTAMSSTLLNWTSNRAIDGKIGPIPEVCKCCSGTKNSQLSWWTVDLGQRYPISSVTVYSRDNEEKYKQLTDFKLYFSNNTGQRSYHLVENTTRRIDGNEHVLTFSNQLTRYIKIERPGILTLCEVLVTEGECEVGTFGEECSQICHCADERACDKRNGHCQSDACKFGWIGKSCNKECPKNSFGDKCSESCFCADGTCTNDYGICENGCQDGYTGFHCNQVDEMNNQTHQGEKEKNSTALVAGVVSGSIIVLILSALIVAVLIFRKRKSENNKSHYSTPKSRAAQDDPDYDTLDVPNDNQGQRSTAYENEVVSSM